MMIDDIQDEEEDDIHTMESQQQIAWYLIDTERTFCKVWDNFVVTLISIYTFVVTPVILVFPQIYTSCATELDSNGACPDNNYIHKTSAQQNLKNIELAIDIIYTIEIMFCFVKRTLSRRDIHSISVYYLKTFAIFDAIATFPEMIFFNEGRDFYFLKVFRFAHLYRLPIPLQQFMKCIMSKYSKKRQNDLTSFAILILLVIYINHICACIWIYLGYSNPCTDTTADSTCNKSWVYYYDF